MPLSAQQADRLDHLRDLEDGWVGDGLGDAPTAPALTTASDLLALLPEHEQDLWHLEPDADGGIKFERQDVADTSLMVFVDVDRRGASTLVWFDSSNRRHQRQYPQAAVCGAGLLDLVGLYAPGVPAAA